jgi:GT2 family glycosyltransferase
MPRVSVVIPNWNGAHWLDPCLNALELQTFRDFEVVVVDNGSTDGSVERLRARRDAGSLALRLVELPHNIGFAAGINAGIATCTAEFIAALNNDTEPCAEWLAALVAALEANSAAGSAASAMLCLSEPDRIDTIGDGYRWDGRAYKIGCGSLASRMPAEPFEVFGACAGAALYRRSMLDEIGLFDERYFAYMEDVDLAIRARLAGWGCICVPKAVVLHAGSGSSGGGMSDFSVRLTTKNIYATILKSVPAPLAPVLLLASVATLAGGMLTAVFFDRPRWLRSRMGAVILGMQAALREAPSMLATRGRTQATRKLSTLAFTRLLVESAALRRRFARGGEA